MAINQFIAAAAGADILIMESADTLPEPDAIPAMVARFADPRVHWHVGDVQDTLPAADVSGRADHQRLILFDLDIYEPTAFAWDVLAPDLQPGDLMYFDEAMDADERRVLDEKVLPAISCEPVGSTSLALGLQVTAPVAR